jgi:hypothetical protein
MRYWMCIWLLPLTATMTTSITSAADLAASTDPTGSLIALEKKWVAALQKSDTKTLSELWAQTYIDTDETGHHPELFTPRGPWQRR